MRAYGERESAPPTNNASAPKAARKGLVERGERLARCVTMEPRDLKVGMTVYRVIRWAFTWPELGTIFSANPPASQSSGTCLTPARHSTNADTFRLSEVYTVASDNWGSENSMPNMVANGLT